MALYAKDFSKVLSELLDRSRVTCYQINQFTGLDQSYLSRLRSGEKTNPTAETLVKICLGLAHFSAKMDFDDFEALLNAAGRSLSAK